MTEHVVEKLDAYALGALAPADAERIAQHLSTCASCREEAAALAEIVGALPETVALREPRPTLRDRVLAAAKADGSQPISGTSPRWSLGRVRPWRVGVAAVAAAFIVLGAADVDAYRRLVAVSAERDQYNKTLESIREGARTWYMAGSGSFAGSGGTLYDPRARGKQPFVLFHDLPPIAEGKVLAIWLVGPDSTWARAATFRPNGQDVQIVEINTEVAGFARCAVSLDDSPWGKHGTVVMESRIAPPTSTP